MKFSIKISLYWFLLGPAAALLISYISRLVFEHFSPGSLSSFPDIAAVYPLGLILSLLTPWGWLMYGGLLLMSAEKYRVGVWCSITGAVLLGVFWPVWATFLRQ